MVIISLRFWSSPQQYTFRGYSMGQQRITVMLAAAVM
jgi:hypothetical protein